jgi:hypothetical protein
MRQAGRRPRFVRTCAFCTGPLLSFRTENSGLNAFDDILHSCPACGLYRICDEMAQALSSDPVKRHAAARFVREAAAEGLLPRLCVQREDFREIISPFARALQKCRNCRKEAPKKLADGTFVHRDEEQTPCPSAAEWETISRSTDP